MLPQLLLNGLAAGSIYALVALALVTVYQSSSVANFAQGETGMIAAYVAWIAVVALGWPFGGAVAAALATGVLLGVLLEFLFIRRAKHPSPLNLIILTLGFQLALFGLAGWAWGAEGRALPFPVSQAGSVQVGPAVVSGHNLLTILTALGLMAGLWVFFRFTRTGLGIRAARQDETAARLNGIPTRRLRAASFGLAGGVAAVAALLVAPVTTLDPALMWEPLLRGFAAAVLGGMTTLPGAAAGGYLLGIIESLFGAYISLEFKSVVPFAVIVGVLWFRPAGLFGRHFVRKV